MIFRKAKTDDIPQLNDLLFQVHKIHADARPDLFKPGAKKYNDSDLETIINTEDTPIFVLAEQEEILGYAFCQIIKENEHSRVLNTLYIDDLCVKESLRGKKIGTQILSNVKKFAEEIGCHNITLNVWALNQSALKFYESNGMKIQKYGMEMLL